MPAKLPKLGGLKGGRALTESLRKMADEPVSIDDGGDVITRAQVLADLIWKLALGHTEEGEDADGRPYKRVVPPVAWAMQYVYERCEGKTPVAQQDETQGIKAADKVRQLAVDRINKLAPVARKAGPPKFKPKVTV